jgi:hypothetical protein
MDRSALEGPHGVLEHVSFVESYAGLHQQFPIDPVKMSATVFDNSPDVAKQVRAAATFENGNSIFRRKHDVIGDGGDRRHRTIVPRSTPPGLAGPFTSCP